MKFDTIRHFGDLVPLCPFCNTALKTELSPRLTPDFRPKYNMTFTDTTFYDPLFKSELMGVFGDQVSKVEDEEAKKRNTMVYTSTEDEDSITFQYEYLGRSHPIFSVAKDTNRIVGDLDRVQKVIWDHKIHLMRYCDSQECQEKGNRYLSETSLVVLERVSKRLCPFHLNLEMAAITPKQRMYGLITPYNHAKNHKTLLVAINKNEIISQVPIIHLHNIKNGEVLTNKIQTLITFS